MTTDHSASSKPSQREAEVDPHGDPGPAIGQILHRLAAAGEESEGRTAFFRAAMREICGFFQSPYGAIEVNTVDQLIRVEEAPREESVGPWRDALQDLMSTALAGSGRARFQIVESRSENLSAALMVAPLFAEDGRSCGALVCATQVSGRDEARFRLAQLERLAIFLTLFSNQAQLRAAAEEEPESTTDHSALVAMASAFKSRTQFAFSITNGLRARTGCDVVALATIKGSRAKIISISGADEVKPRSPGVHAMTAAIEECLDAERPIAWPQSEDWTEEEGPRAFGLHRQWSKSAGGSGVATIPLATADGIVAILALRRPPGETFDPDFIEKIRGAAAGYAPSLQLVHEARRSWIAHTFCGVFETLKDFGRPGRWPLQLLRVGLVALALWIAFGTLPHEVSSSAVLVRPDRHVLGAPMPAVLLQAETRPGDRVAKGDILAVLDTRALELERDRSRAELRVAEVEAGRAMAEGAPAEARMARARRDSLEASLNVLDHRIAAATIRSPIDGVILEGDLRQRVGDTLTQGEPLFQVAPERDWRVEIEIDESDIALVENAESGEFSSRAFPERRHPLRILSQQPRTESRNSKNVVVIEAACEIDATWLRSGMEGRAVIKAGRKRVWWIVGRQAIDWVQLNLWL